MPARLKEKYQQELIPSLRKEFGYRNVMQVPKVAKVVVNMGMGAASQNPKLLETAAEEMARLTGQKAAITRAKKSISNFKIRKNMPIGCKVTLRGERMYEFLDRLINIAIPRVRDFRGLPSRAFDSQGNYTLGIKEQIIFPEVEVEKADRIHGMDVCIVTTARTDQEAKRLLQLLGMPFRN